MKKLFTAIVVIFALLVITNYQSSAEEDVIHGCVHKTTGKLRIVDDPDKCKRRENSISLNQMGPAEPHFNPIYPDGFDNFIPITDTDYTVPPDKNLYITSLSGVSEPCYLYIDGYNFGRGRLARDRPYIIGSGQLVAAGTYSGEIGDWSYTFNGFLVDASVTPVTTNDQTPFTVPAGRTLFILHVYSSGNPELNGAELWIDDFRYIYDAINFSGAIIVVGSGQVVSSPSTPYCIWNGYLR